MSNKNKNKYSKLPTQPTKLGEAYNTKPAISEETATEESSLLITEPVFNNETVLSTEPVEAINLRKEYKLISIRGISNVLQDEVTKHLNEGWELVGGVSTTMYMDGYTATPVWSQALIKVFSN